MKRVALTASSLEDEIIEVYIGKLLRVFTSALAGKPGGVMSGWLGKGLFRRGQRRAEMQHARMRRDLLKMDEQLGQSLAFTGRPE